MAIECLDESGAVGGFVADIRFAAPFDAVVGSASDLDRPLPRSDAVLCSLLERQAVEALARILRVSSFAEAARGQIAGSLSIGDTSAEGVARALWLSSRTLRRRLSDCGVSDQVLFDGVRWDLTRPGSSVGEVAYSLGFSDTSAFHKAFRRWAGKRPSDLTSGTDGLRTLHDPTDQTKRG